MPSWLMQKTKSLVTMCSGLLPAIIEALCSSRGDVLKPWTVQINQHISLQASAACQAS